MKKLFIALMIVFVLVGAAFSADWMRYSDQQTADAAITAKPGILSGVVLSGTSAANYTISIYDNATAASGSQVLPTITVNMASDTAKGKQLFFPIGVQFYNGIYADITVTAGTAYYEIYYRSE